MLTVIDRCLYHISPLSIFPVNENYHISRKRKEPNTNKKKQIWHLYLDHIIETRSKDWLSLEFYLLLL